MPFPLDKDVRRTTYIARADETPRRRDAAVTKDRVATGAVLLLVISLPRLVLLFTLPFPMLRGPVPQRVSGEVPDLSALTIASDFPPDSPRRRPPLQPASPAFPAGSSSSPAHSNPLCS